MAVSNSFDFTVTRDNVIHAAFRIIGILAPGDTPLAARVTTAAEALNMMLKTWQAEGIGLWLNQEVTLLLQADDVDYSIGPSGDHCSGTVVKTEVATAAAAADTDIVVDSITGISDGDYAGIETDNGDIHWTTINGDPADSTIVLTAGLDYAAAVDNHVYTYTTKTQRPLEIIDAHLRNADDNDVALSIISRQEYKALSDKASEATPNQIYYDGQLTNGVLYVWPEPGDVKDRIIMTIKRPICDMDSATDNFDLPIEWAKAIKFNLAMELAPEYDVPISSDVVALALSSKKAVSGFDRETTSIYFRPDRG
jgi:hypothetical protein